MITAALVLIATVLGVKLVAGVTIGYIHRTVHILGQVDILRDALDVRTARYAPPSPASSSPARQPR